MFVCMYVPYMWIIKLMVYRLDNILPTDLAIISHIFTLKSVMLMLMLMYVVYIKCILTSTLKFYFSKYMYNMYVFMSVCTGNRIYLHVTYSKYTLLFYLSSAN